MQRCKLTSYYCFQPVIRIFGHFALGHCFTIFTLAVQHAQASIVLELKCGSISATKLVIGRCCLRTGSTLETLKADEK